MSQRKKLDADLIMEHARTQLFIRGMINIGPQAIGMPIIRIDIVCMCAPDLDSSNGPTSCWLSFFDRLKKQDEPPELFLDYRCWPGDPDFSEELQGWRLQLSVWYDYFESQVILTPGDDRKFKIMPLTHPYIRQQFGSIRALLPVVAARYEVIEPIFSVVSRRLEKFLLEQEQRWNKTFQLLQTLG